MGLYNVLLSYINKKKQIDALKKYKQIVASKNNEITDSNYWYDFGYIYFGIFNYSGYTREEVIKRFSDNEHYVRDIFKAAYYDDYKCIYDNKEIATIILEGSNAFINEAKEKDITKQEASEIETVVIEYLSKNQQISKRSRN